MKFFESDNGLVNLQHIVHLNKRGQNQIEAWRPCDGVDRKTFDSTKERDAMYNRIRQALVWAEL